MMASPISYVTLYYVQILVMLSELLLYLLAGMFGWVESLVNLVNCLPNCL